MKKCVLGQKIADYPANSSIYNTFENRQLSSVLYQYYFGMLESPLLEDVFEKLPVKKDEILEDGFFSFILQTVNDRSYDPEQELPTMGGSNLCKEIILFDNNGFKNKNLKNIKFLLSTQTKEKKETYFSNNPLIAFDMISTNHYDLIDLLLNEGALIEYVDKNNRIYNLFLNAVSQLNIKLIITISKFIDLEICKKGLMLIEQMENTQKNTVNDYQMYSVVYKKPFIEKTKQVLNNIFLSKKLEQELPIIQIQEQSKNKI